MTKLRLIYHLVLTSIHLPNSLGTTLKISPSSHIINKHITHKKHYLTEFLLFLVIMWQQMRYLISNNTKLFWSIYVEKARQKLPKEFGRKSYTVWFSIPATKSANHFPPGLNSRGLELNQVEIGGKRRGKRASSAGQNELIVQLSLLSSLWCQHNKPQRNTQMPPTRSSDVEKNPNTEEWCAREFLQNFIYNILLYIGAQASNTQADACIVKSKLLFSFLILPSACQRTADKLPAPLLCCRAFLMHVFECKSGWR